MENPGFHGVAFLLTLGSLPIACFHDEGLPSDTTEAGTSTSGVTTGDTTTGFAELCELYVDQVVTCNPVLVGMEDLVLAQCEASELVDYTPECATLLRDLLSCYSSVNCADTTACADQSQLFDSECPAGQSCTAYGMKAAQCWGSDPVTAAQDCQEEVSYYLTYSQMCGLAAEDHYVCLSTLSCDDFVADTGCADTKAAYQTLCD